MARKNDKPNARQTDARFARVVQAFERERTVSRGRSKGFGPGALRVNSKIFAMLSSKGEFVHEDLAYEWGINRQKIEFPPPKKPFEGNGKILLILKRQADGSWKVALEAWNGSPQPQATE